MSIREGGLVEGALLHVDPESDDDTSKVQDPEPETDAARHARTMTSWITMVDEMSDESLRATKAWKQAISPIVDIHRRGGSKALAYLIVTRAGVDGGQTWLDTNVEELRQLARLVSDGSQRTN